MVKHADVVSTIVSTLHQIQKDLYTKHSAFTHAHTATAQTRDEFKQKIEDGFVLAHRDGTSETEEKIKEEMKATIRCIPFDQPEQAGTCVYSGKPSTKMVLFAKAY